MTDFFPQLQRFQCLSQSIQYNGLQDTHTVYVTLEPSGACRIQTVFGLSAETVFGQLGTDESLLYQFFNSRETLKRIHFHELPSPRLGTPTLPDPYSGTRQANTDRSEECNQDRQILIGSVDIEGDDYLRILGCNTPRGLVLCLPIFLLAIARAISNGFASGAVWELLWFCLPIAAKRI
jgi:hypothetical protein